MVLFRNKEEGREAFSVFDSIIKTAQEIMLIFGTAYLTCIKINVKNIAKERYFTIIYI